MSEHDLQQLGARQFDLEGYLIGLRRQVDDALAGYLERIAIPQSDDGRSGRALGLDRAARDAVLSGGKRLRPCLVLASCEAAGQPARAALPAACAVELIHSYSLVHDDLPAMDDADERRGKPSCHTQYGVAAATLVGDGLLTLAFEILCGAAHDASDDGQPRVEAATATQAAVELARAAGFGGMVGGQAMDLELKQAPPTFERLEQCHRHKTAALFRASAILGGLFGRADADRLQQLSDYGEHLGLAFQHADDTRDRDFSAHRELALSRCRELTGRAAEIANNFGSIGEPLAALAMVVAQRAV